MDKGNTRFANFQENLHGREVSESLYIRKVWTHFKLPVE